MYFSIVQDDTATLNELEDNRINRLLSLEMDSSGKCIDPCIPQLNVPLEKSSVEKAEKIILRTPKKSTNENKENNRHLTFNKDVHAIRQIEEDLCHTYRKRGKQNIPDQLQGRN